VLSLIALVATSASAAVPVTVTIHPILVNDGRAQKDAHVHGTDVVFMDAYYAGQTPSNWYVKTYSIPGRQFWDITTSGSAGRPDISRDYVAWEQLAGISDTHIWARKRGEAINTPVCTLPGRRASVGLGQGVAAWVDLRDGGRAIYGRYLNGSSEFVISPTAGTNTPQIAFSGDTVVWDDYRNGKWGIYGYNLVTKQEFDVYTGPDTTKIPDISGDVVVYQSQRNGLIHIYGYHLPTQTEFPITTGPLSRLYPAIDGNLVVYHGKDPTTLIDNIYATNIATGTTATVSDTAVGGKLPDVSGNIVVWEGGRADGGDVYAATVEMPGMFMSGGFNTGMLGWTTTGGGTADAVNRPDDPGNTCVEMLTGSPVSITQNVHTPPVGFILSFEYEWLTTTGELTVELDGTLLETLEAPGTLSGMFELYSQAFTDPTLTELHEVPLTLTLDGVTASGIRLDTIDLHVLPEPATLLLLCGGMGVLARRRRR